MKKNLKVSISKIIIYDSLYKMISDLNTNNNLNDLLPYSYITSKIDAFNYYLNFYSNKKIKNKKAVAIYINI